MNSSCSRCGLKVEEIGFTFYEVDQQNKKHKLGTFCVNCATELVDQLKGKLEWFHVAHSWKGYVNPEARCLLENAGLIHPKHNPQYMEIEPTETKRRKIDRADTLTILRVKHAGGLISQGEYEKLLREL